MLSSRRGLRRFKDGLMFHVYTRDSYQPRQTLDFENIAIYLSETPYKSISLYFRVRERGVVDNQQHSWRILLHALFRLRRLSKAEN